MKLAQLTMGPALVQPHVLLLPRPMQSHLHPFLSLAHFLTASGISVTLICASSSPGASSAKTDAISLQSQASGSSIRIEAIQADILPSATGDGNMYEALEKLMQKLNQEDNPPCCLIGDVSLPGCRNFALKYGLSWVVLCTFAAFLACLGFHLPEMIARGYIPAVDDESQKRVIDFIPELSPICVMDLPSRLKAEEGVGSPGFVQLMNMFESLRDADRTLVNTMYELESFALESLKSVRMESVGPLFKVSPIASIGCFELSLRQEDKSCLAWLDQWRESSVLYISFGSIAALEKHVFEELAHGLEASGESFLWVIRPDAHKDKAMTTEALLPEGFGERTRDRGLVISWAPQLTVLAHPAVGAFLTHCGWNSILESLSHGIPMLGFPQEAEQNTNLKYVVEDWKVGLPLLQADVRKVERIQVRQAMEAMMKGSEGAEARKRACEWRDIADRAPYGTSKLNLEKFVDDLKHGHLKRLNA